MNQTIARLSDIVEQAQSLINDLSSGITDRGISLVEAEEEILQLLNRLGTFLLSETLQKVEEPTEAPRVRLSDGRTARYKATETVSFICRFAGTVEFSRRRYGIEGGGSFYPLDQALGLDRCGGRFCPLLSYLLSRFGASDAYGAAAEDLSAALGFSVSASAVQSATERTGERLPHNPVHSIGEEHQSTACELFVVEIDGVLSPQIAASEEESGRAVLSRPTEYKECNVAVIRKENPGQVLFDSWHGAQYGRRERFREYLHRGAVAMGQLVAKRVVFVADGARHNWELCWDLFPGATQVLDFYHAAEHLGSFCALFTDQGKGKRTFHRWRALMWDGRVLEVKAEMQSALFREISARSEAQKHLNYITTNQERMQYDLYREEGLPCASGLAEGACKSVVAKRFKGSGMRWRKKDNEQTLECRLAHLNGTLKHAFLPQPQPFRPLPRRERFAA